MANAPIAFEFTFNLVPPECYETPFARDAWAANIRELVQSWLEIDLECYGVPVVPTDVVAKSVDKSPLWIVTKYAYLRETHSIINSVHHTDEGQAAGVQLFYRTKAEAEIACEAINTLYPGATCVPEYRRKIYSAVEVPRPFKGL